MLRGLAAKSCRKEQRDISGMRRTALQNVLSSLSIIHSTVSFPFTRFACMHLAFSVADLLLQV